MCTEYNYCCLVSPEVLRRVKFEHDRLHTVYDPSIDPDSLQDRYRALYKEGIVTIVAGHAILEKRKNVRDLIGH